ncbi:hypothetical protein ACSFA7_26390 [Variovorax sp. LT1R20]|uniref:hypothetical protein n=1 Tax=Variovorax sp. LT1R20 TaxID=3443729 RepID=UPI003F478B11
MATFNHIDSTPGVMHVGKPGEPIPDGFEQVRQLRLKRSLFYPGTYRALMPELLAVRLVNCKVGDHGPLVIVEFSDGRARPMYVLDLEDISDRLFDSLPNADRDRIVDHFFSVPPAELAQGFRLDDGVVFTLERHCCDVRLWSSRVKRGGSMTIQPSFHITRNSDLIVSRMRSRRTAERQFAIEIGELQ